MFRRLMSPRAALLEASSAGGSVQQLGFTVRPARNLSELQEVVALRHAAYGRHRVQPGRPAPDRYDFMPNAVVLVAIDKSSGHVIGSIRVVTGDVGPLELDAYVTLPRDITGVPAEAARLVVGRTRSRVLVKLALWKAFHRLCLGRGVDSMVLAARKPLDDDYAWLGFQDLNGRPDWFVPGGAFPDPHRVLRLSMHGLAERWRSHSHDLYHFNVEVVHPDIRPFCDDCINPLARFAGQPMPADLESAVRASRTIEWPIELAGWMPV